MNSSVDADVFNAAQGGVVIREGVSDQGGLGGLGVMLMNTLNFITTRK